VTGLVALAALDAFSRTWLGTLLSVVTLLLAVLAGVGVDTLLGAVTSTVTDLLAVDTLNLWYGVLALSLLLLAVLANMTKLTAIAAQRYTAVLNVAAGGKALQVLSRVLGPALCHFGAARFGRELNGQNKLAVCVTDEVDDGHVGGDLLLLGDKEDCKIILTESLLDGGKVELFHGSASISLQADAEDVKVLLFGSIDQSDPGSLSVHLRDARPVDNAAGLAVDSAVTLLVTELAGSIEGSLDTLVSTV
jgi:hypothetical protein